MKEGHSNLRKEIHYVFSHPQSTWSPVVSRPQDLPHRGGSERQVKSQKESCPLGNCRNLHSGCMYLEEEGRQQRTGQGCDFLARLVPRTFIEPPVIGLVASSLAWSGMQA